MKNKIIEFIKTELNTIFLFLIACIVFLITFILANFDMRYYYLALKILVFIFFTYILVRYLTYKEKISLNERIIKLTSQRDELENTLIQNQKEIKEYFLLWVHQIKTPISIIKILLENPDNLQEINTQIFSIEQYTNMAISYIKLQDSSTDMDICEIDIDDIIKAVLKKYSMLFISKNISLNYTKINSKVISDTKWLSILIEQILSNAIKYTNNGSISIYFSDNTLHIKDTGIGIRSEDINKIFDKGYSGYNGRLNEKSSGLGLYLVKCISKRINVKISVESELGRGSVFSIKFPDNLSKL